MSLLADLARAKSEEDVKDAYIAALDLRDFFKGLVDIRTDKVWFEAKEAPTAPLLMFAQLLVYVRDARARGEPIPPFLAVIDREKAALLPTRSALPALDDATITWPASGSLVSRELAERLGPHIGRAFTTYPVTTLADEFCQAITSAIRDGEIIRTPITPDNLRQVFDKWVAMIGSELGKVKPTDYAAMFFADMMHDGENAAMTNLPARLLKEGDKPVFLLRGDLYTFGSEVGYRSFWSIYDRPPEAIYRHYLLQRRDSLLPIDEQKFKGAFYTPVHIVEKAYDQLTATLGAGWQERYIVWDMCCGVGNLELKHSNYRNVFMSTLDEDNITMMKAEKICLGAEMFQYDYLNDDITDFGEIDYSLTNKVPLALRQAIMDAREGKEGAKPILVLINPPYAETGAGVGQGDKNKVGVEKTKINNVMRENNLGYASKELFTQFLVRIMLEMPNITLAMFSTLKYVNAPNFEPFRHKWQARYMSGFVVPSRAFEGLRGEFPIGFLVWDTSSKCATDVVSVTVLNRDGDLIAEKRYEVRPRSSYLNVWMDKTVPKGPAALPLSNALNISKNPRPKRQLAGALGYLYASNNDLQHAATETLIASSIYTGGNGGGVYLTQDNLWQAAIVFAIRRLIKPTWLNDRDQFLQPSEPLTDTFKSDCLVWMLFNGSNLTAGADGLRWDDRDWSLVNHFIPFTEAEVGASGRFESDFMVRYMTGMALSPEAQAVLDEGRTLWTRYHATRFPRAIREEFKLNRPDAGWYQVRRALKAYDTTEPTDFGPFEDAYAALGDKLRPMVFELGFLPG